MLKTAVEAAKGAGRIISERYPDKCSITMKGFRDIVTDVDTETESFICDLIKSRFPDHSIISEESGDHITGSRYTWVVDPLDGTNNYAHQHPMFAVSIAVLEEKNPIIGVIYDPLRDHTFAAHTGGGATLNESPIHVSGVKELQNALLSIDWGHENNVREEMLDYLHRVLPCCGTIRTLGSAALALAYVAAGWLDAYFQPGLKPWDTAAGMLLVEEAGGRCTTIQGAAYTFRSSRCLATNGLIHDELLKTICDPDK